MAEEIVMQLTVTSTPDGFQVTTHLAQGYTEEHLYEAVQMWADDALSDEPQSPGWGAL